ncbi:D-Tyr tRNAtyr deacylase-like domain-containing protein [Mrakia frigida]|uniref:D-tyrosyl-tRNA(Tyr) deacylase n=1 Tax=Mrakia frigida TaxID=29902 RepID=UPI003FCC06AF
MKAVITRVKAASVTVDGVVISQISNGLLALIGIGHDDTPADLASLIKKILSIKIFPPPPPATGDWKSTVKDIEGQILCVSQFTLLARTQRGAKLDFHHAMNPTDAKSMYDDFLTALGKSYDPAKIKDGRFGAMMDVMSINDGPVTVLLDTKEPKPASSSTTSTPSSSSSTNLPALSVKKDKKKNKGTLFDQAKLRELAAISSSVTTTTPLEVEVEVVEKGGEQLELEVAGSKGG